MPSLESWDFSLNSFLWNYCILNSPWYGSSIFENLFHYNHFCGMVNSLCSYSHVYWNPYRYASRVRCIVNDTSKHVAPKEIVRLKKLIAYWKEQAGKRSDDELEEIQEERVSKEKADNRLTGWQRGATPECSWSCSSVLRICDSDEFCNHSLTERSDMIWRCCTLIV